MVSNQRCIDKALHGIKGKCPAEKKFDFISISVFCEGLQSYCLRLVGIVRVRVLPLPNSLPAVFKRSSDSCEHVFDGRLLLLFNLLRCTEELDPSPHVWAPSRQGTTITLSIEERCFVIA
mmetsp:Transcript_55227/g.82158  ORF Transcript_55227/g.82158 Transcript_55227/m.82158 type:complete len:120 (+) Transcript_55227:287-646(+)